MSTPPLNPQMRAVRMAQAQRRLDEAVRLEREAATMRAAAQGLAQTWQFAIKDGQVIDVDTRPDEP